MSKKKTITMKKGTAVINVDADRQKHYEDLGYTVLKNGEAGKGRKSAGSTKYTSDI